MAYYENQLVPSIAEAGDDPLTAWQQFGCQMAELTVTGTPVEIDATGRRLPYVPPTPADRMVLHVPQGSKGRALVVGLPPELSAAQLATYDLLVGGRQKMRDQEAGNLGNYDVLNANTSSDEPRLGAPSWLGDDTPSRNVRRPQPSTRAGRSSYAE